MLNNRSDSFNVRIKYWVYFWVFCHIGYFGIGYFVLTPIWPWPSWNYSIINFSHAFHFLGDKFFARVFNVIRNKKISGQFNKMAQLYGSIFSK